MGGGIKLSYATESTSEISAEPSAVKSESENFFVRAFHSITNLISSFFSWSIETFGNVAGRILGWLGVGTPALFILWVIKKIIGFFVNKHVVSPFKRAVNKHAMKRYGKNIFKNDEVEIKAPRHALTEWDIRYIAEEKYGFVHHDNSYRDGHEVYSEWTYAGFTWYGVFFCDDGVRTYKGLFADETDFMSYDELRNDEYMTMEYLKMRFEGFPDEFYNALMELKEA